MKTKTQRFVMLIVTITAMLAGGTLVTGCSTTFAQPDTVENSAARMTVQYAVMKYIAAAKDASQQQARADRVAAVAGKAIDLVDAGTVSTVPLIEQAVRDQIDWSTISLPDRLLIDNLIVLVRQELLARIRDKAMPADTALAVRQVLSWIESAAMLSGAQ